uniref:Integrase catalytic domain-containing protein n=1 Tax=Strongyloides papillosus TaxID=174720 RepID=A0A0N5CFP7_STREA
MLRSDIGPAFIANPVTDYLTSNAVVERFNRILRSAIRICKEEPLTTITTHFTYVYNRSKNTSTGFSPAQTLLNTPDCITNELSIHNGCSGIHNVIKETREQFYEPELKRHGLKLKDGDLVLRKIMHRKDASTSAKNQPTWKGHFKVVKHLYGDTYEIQKVGDHHRTRSAVDKVHADRLKRYVQ